MPNYSQMIPISYIQAFRLNVGNMKTEYQYAAVLRGFFLIQLHRTTSFAMRRLPERVNRRIVTEEGRQQDLETAENRIAEIDSVIMKLFEQSALGKISDERFEKMLSAYENEQKELTQRRIDLKAKIIAEEKKTQNTNQFLETIRKYETVTELDRSMLVELIDSIFVYQAEEPAGSVSRE